MHKIVVKKKDRDPFAEFSFANPEQTTPTTESQEKESNTEEQIVGVNPITQKPIIKQIKKKPVIRGIIDKTPAAEEKKQELAPHEEEERLYQDLTVAEMRKKQLQDITPVSNEPAVEKPRQLGEAREKTREEAAELARRIWQEREDQKPWHKRFARRLGLQ